MLGLHRNLLKKLISETLHVKPEDILLDSGLSSTDYLFKTGTFLLDISKLQFTVRQAEKGVYQYQPLKPEQKEVIMKKVNKLQFKNGATHVEVEKGLYVNLLGGFTSSPSSDVAGKAYHEFLKTAYSSTVITSEVLIEKIKEIHNDKNLAAAFADAQFCNQLTNAVVSYTAGEINSLIEEKVPPMKYEEAIAEIKSKTNSAKALITAYHDVELEKQKVALDEAAKAEVEKKIKELDEKITELEKEVTQKYTENIHEIQKTLTSIYSVILTKQAEQEINEQEQAYRNKFNEILKDMSDKLDIIAENEVKAGKKRDEIVQSYTNATLTLFKIFGVTVNKETHKLEIPENITSLIEELHLTLDDLTNHEKVVEALENYLKTEKGQKDEDLKKHLPNIKKLLGHDPNKYLEDADFSEFSVDA